MGKGKSDADRQSTRAEPPADPGAEPVVASGAEPPGGSVAAPGDDRGAAPGDGSRDESAGGSGAAPVGGTRFEPVADSRSDDVAWPPVTWPPAPGTVLGGYWVQLSVADPDSDAPALYAALDDDRVWEHVPGRPGSAATLARQLRARRADPTQVTWVVRLRRSVAGLAEGAVVGATSYLDAAPVDARAEIGWTLYSPAVWGSAVNPECKLLLLAYAFEVAGLGRVQLKTDVRNGRSQVAIAGLGASYEGTLRRYQRRADGTVRDTALFSIVAEDWPGVRDGLRRRLATFLDPG